MATSAMKQAENCGTKIACKVEFLAASDSRSWVAKFFGVTVATFFIILALCAEVPLPP
jgi:hypothetical protein